MVSNSPPAQPRPREGASGHCGSLNQLCHKPPTSYARSGNDAYPQTPHTPRTTPPDHPTPPHSTHTPTLFHRAPALTLTLTLTPTIPRNLKRLFARCLFSAVGQPPWLEIINRQMEEPASTTRRQAKRTALKPGSTRARVLEKMCARCERTAAQGLLSGKCSWLKAAVASWVLNAPQIAYVYSSRQWRFVGHSLKRNRPNPIWSTWGNLALFV